MIAHHVIAVGRQHQRRHRPRIAEPRRHIRLRQQPAVHIHPTFINAQSIAGPRDHALDVTLLRIARVIEHHYIAAADLLEVIRKLVDEDAILVLQTRQHAGALYPHRLVEKRDDEERDGE